MRGYYIPCCAQHKYKSNCCLTNGKKARIHVYSQDCFQSTHAGDPAHKYFDQLFKPERFFEENEPLFSDRYIQKVLYT